MAMDMAVSLAETPRWTLRDAMLHGCIAACKASCIPETVLRCLCLIKLIEASHYVCKNSAYFTRLEIPPSEKKISEKCHKFVGYLASPHTTHKTSFHQAQHPVGPAALTEALLSSFSPALSYGILTTNQSHKNLPKIAPRIIEMKIYPL